MSAIIVRSGVSVNQEIRVLEILVANPQGLYGSDFVRLDSRLSKWNIYSVLERLVARGFVREIEEPAFNGLTSRTRHVITEDGRRRAREELRIANAHEWSSVSENQIPEDQSVAAAVLAYDAAIRE